MSNDPFWAVIDTQLEQLKTATSAADVITILAPANDPYTTVLGDRDRGYGAEGFFAGSGGDGTVRDSLREAGWTSVWFEASYYYAMRAPDGSAITYVEGDIYPHDTREGK